MVIDDLRPCPARPWSSREGSTLPAWALSSGIAERSRAVAAAARQFQRPDRPGRGVRPDGAVPAARRDDRGRRGAPRQDADGRRLHDVRQVAAAVEELFAEALAEGLRARTSPAGCCARRTRRSPTRSAASTVARGRTATPRLEQAFSCECGDPACDASVLVPLRELSSGPSWRRATTEHHALPEHRDVDVVVVAQGRVAVAGVGG